MTKKIGYDDKMMDEIKEDRIGGVPQNTDLEEFEDADLFNYDVDSVLEDVVMVKFVEGSDSIRGGIHIPSNMELKTWRIGKVILSGPKTTVKAGQVVFFSRDRGIAASNLNGASKVIFIRESELMGILKHK